MRCFRGRGGGGVLGAIKRQTSHVPNLIPSIKYIKDRRLSHLGWTYLISIDQRIKLEWATWQIRLSYSLSKIAK